MNIPKAIEILTLWEGPESETAQQDLFAAKELGIEALTRVRNQRKFKLSYHMKLLPGETEE